MVRRYYRQDLRERLQRNFAPEPARGRGFGQPYGRAGGFGESARRGGFGQGGGGRFANRPQGSARPQLARGPYQAASPSFALSPIMRGQRSALSRREALILQALLNHPWLLHDHLEEVAALELAHPEAHRLRAGIIAAFAGEDHTDDPQAEAERLRANLQRSNFSELLQRVERAVTTRDVWAVEPDAAREDVLATWHQLVSLHRQWHSLLRELKDAELALGDAPTEANNAWLADVKGRLAQTDGTEALIEGFGDSSGRQRRSE